MEVPSSPENTNKIMSIINEHQQISYNELVEFASSSGIDEATLKNILKDLENMKNVASRNIGGMLIYYPLVQEPHLQKILIVEDDPNINRLMALSVSKAFDIKQITQIYDGGEALPKIREIKPDLIILDLMLPNKSGLDICQTVKSDPEIKNAIVIIVSAVDPTTNRLKSLQYGADYYIKKPFDPMELRSLVTIFLKKKGKRFDPLIDLPDEERISKEVEKAINSGEQYTIGMVKIENLGSYARRFGEKYAFTILRLVSQLLQDIINTSEKNTFIGFLNNESFVIGGQTTSVEDAITRLRKEFNDVLPFILQDVGYKQLDLDIDSLFETKEIPKLGITYSQIEKNEIKERRDEILKTKKSSEKDIGSYTYDELQKLFDSNDFDIKITRGANGVELHVAKSQEEKKYDSDNMNI
ncbi:MAG: response regulator [Candidatus Micrarchaeia archaeon]